MSLLCWDQLFRPPCSRTASPFLPPNSSAQYTLSLHILATCFLPRASMHREYHIISFFPPVCCSSSYSLSFYAAVGLFFNAYLFCISSLDLFSPVPNMRISLTPHCMQSPEQSLAGFIRAQKIANSTGSVCGITNRWFLSSLESEDIMRMHYSRI